MFVTSTLGRGGAERVLTELTRHLAARGNRATIVTVSSADEPAYTLDPRTARVALGAALRGRTYLYQLGALCLRALRFRVLVRRMKPDAVVSFIDLMNFFTLLALCGTGVPVLVSERVYPNRSFLLEENKPWIVRAGAKIFRNFIYRLAEKVVVLTEESRECFPSSLQRKVSVIPNPVFAAPVVKPDRNLPPHSIAAMGRLVPQKRHDLVIRAFAELSPDFPDWTLHIFGEGPLREALRKQIEQTPCPHKIILQGITKTPEAVLRQAELFVLASDFEGFPGALAQALQAGAACVASDCKTGPRELIQHEENGLLFPPGDEKALRLALGACLSSPAVRRAYKEKGPAVSDKFRPEAIFSLWEKVLLLRSTCEDKSA